MNLDIACKSVVRMEMFVYLANKTRYTYPKIKIKIKKKKKRKEKKLTNLEKDMDARMLKIF